MMPKDKMFFYDEFAEEFDRKVNMYDTNRRLELVFDLFLEKEELKDALFLDAGSGTGWFSRKAKERGAIVYSTDVGVNILNQVSKKCDSYRVCGSVLDLPYQDNTFDVVMSTEVIEHTEDPYQAVGQLIRVLKPGGILIITVPNRLWYFAIQFANACELRPYHGYENFVSYSGLKKYLINSGIVLRDYRGFHIFPLLIGFANPFLRFIGFISPFLRFMDRHGRTLGPLMLQIGAFGTKSEASQ